MAVKIRLMRLGKKKQPVYRMVVIDSRKARNGRYIEAIGRYEPRQEPSFVEIDNAKAVEWLQKGAQPTERAKKILEVSGAWSQFKIAKGEIHTIGGEPAPVADEEPVEVEGAASAETEPVAEAIVSEETEESAESEETAESAETEESAEAVTSDSTTEEEE